jgi:hypothetical protein
VDLGADEQKREAGRERRPKRDEVSDRPPPVERDEAGRAGGIVVRDRVMEGFALDLDVAGEVVLDLVGQRLVTLAEVLRIPLVARVGRSPLPVWIHFKRPKLIPADTRRQPRHGPRGQPKWGRPDPYDVRP